MRRWLGWIAIALLLATCSVAVIAYGNPATAQSLDQRTLVISQQLRCPVCHGESVADSSAGISQAIRAIIWRRLTQGETPDQIKAYFASRYGTWILLAPPSSGVGALAWLAPPLLALGGLAFLITLVTDWRRRGRSRMSVPRREYIERVRAELSAESEE